MRDNRIQFCYTKNYKIEHSSWADVLEAARKQGQQQTVETVAGAAAAVVTGTAAKSTDRAATPATGAEAGTSAGTTAW